MTPKSVQRFSDKITLEQGAKRDDDSKKNHVALAGVADPTQRML